MARKDLPRVLCVDDEPRVLEGLTDHLRKRFHVLTATGGETGIELIQSEGPFAVVLSDMRMPGMDGAAFLRKVRELAPDTVRMLLTGQADFDSAITVVNEGQIFRFLTKPCPPQQLLGAFEAAAEQHRLITAERVLLEQTLRGSIKALADVLALTNPLAFGRSTRIRQHALTLAAELDVEDRWPLEVAAMLSQIGFIALPAETVEKVYYGQDLSGREQEMAARLPGIAEKLLGNIPRLEPVLEILAGLDRPLPRRGAQDPVPLASRILKVIVDFDALEARGASAQLALDTMRGRQDWYVPEVLEAFARTRGAAEASDDVRELPIRAVRVGMIFADDVRMHSGTLMVARGYEVTQSFVERARNFRPGLIQEPVRVIVPAVSWVPKTETENNGMRKEQQHDR